MGNYVSDPKKPGNLMVVGGIFIGVGVIVYVASLVGSGIETDVE